MDPQGNPVVDPKKVNFNAEAAVFPTCQTFYTRRLIEKDYVANLYKHLKEVFYTSLPKVMELNKKKEENVKKLVEKLKKTARDADENQHKVDEDQKKTTGEAKVPDVTEIKIQTKSFESSNNDENVKQSVDKTEGTVQKMHGNVQSLY
ncbi:hypothetical protein Hanom_Chr06g00522911 [Helianthus anomalus]